MINSFQIKNFRCFRNFSLGGLKRFNLLLGGSGTGKTALLEALFLAGGVNPEIYFRTRRWRGFGDSLELTGAKESYESIFRDLFFMFDQASGIHIRFNDAATGDRQLTIYYQGSNELSIPLRMPSEREFSVDPIIFSWRTQHGSHESKVLITDGQIKMSGFGSAYPITFIAPPIVTPKLNAAKFSDLSKRRESQVVVETVKKAFPQVEDLSLEMIAGETMIYASIEHLKEKLPLAVLSGGINKFFTILLAIASSPGGVVLVDEMENGWYYKSMVPLMSAICDLCDELGVQLIASTHSYEFMQAVIQVMDGREEQFTVMKATQVNGESAVTMARGPSVRAAIEQSVELR